MNTQDIVQKYDLDIQSFIDKAERVSKVYADLDAQIQASGKNTPLATMAAKQQDVNQALGQQVQIYQKVEAAANSYRAEQKRLETQLKDLKSRQLEFIAAGRYGELKANIKDVEDRLKRVNQVLEDAPKKTTAIGGAFDKVGQAIKTAFTVTGILFVIDKVVELGKKIIDITGQSEKYQNQFTRIFQGNGEAAKGYLSILQNTADTTNFTFDTLADNVAKLASRGIVPTKQELLGLGDVANFINKDFEQLNEAILDANNPERWKELGFTVTTEGNKMTLAYGDFTTTVDKSVEGAYKAIQQFSQLGKVQGSTAEAGLTLTGRMSTLADVFTGLFRTIGQGNTGPLNDVIDLLTRIIQFGVELYKTLSPAINAVGRAFGAIGSAIGGVFKSFSNFQTSAEQSATTAQKFGFYINKYIVNPMVGITLVVAGVIEAFNLIVEGAALAAAKLSGNKGLEATVSAQIKASMARLQSLRSEGQALRKGMDQDLQSYVNQDNQEKRRQERRARLAEEAAQAAISGNGKTNTKPPFDKKAADKATKEAEKAATDEKNLLLKVQDDYLKEFKQLQDSYDKERLEALNKDSEAYVKEKAKLDRQAIEAERDHLENLLQLAASGTTRINSVTKKREVVPNTSVKLPTDVANLYAGRIAGVNAEESRKLEEIAYQARIRQLGINRQFDDLEVEEVKHKWEGIIREELKGFTGSAEARTAKEAELRAKQKRDEERTKIQQAIGAIKQQEEISLAFVDSAQVDRDLEAQQKANHGFLNLELEREKQRLKIRIESGKKLIEYLEEQGAKENAVLITQTKAAVNAAGKQLEGLNKLTAFSGLDGGSLVGKLLGVKDEDLDKFKEALSVVGESISQISQLQVEASERRIQLIEAELAAKEEQLKTEEEREKAGAANNLERVRDEIEALKAQKAEEQQVKKRALAAQQLLDIASITSTNAVTAANLIASAAASFRSAAESSFNPILGVIQAIAAIAVIFATFASVKAKVAALNAPTTGLRKGGRIPLTGRSHEQGGHRIEGTEFEVERGEHFINAADSERYDKTLQALNKNNPLLALQSLMREGGLSMPAAFIEQVRQPGGGVVINQAAVDLSPLQNDIASLRDELQAIRNNTKPGKQRTALGDGWVLEQEGNRETVRKVKTP